MTWLVINAVTFMPLITLSLDSAINVFFKQCMDAKIGKKMIPKKPKTTVTVTTILNWFQGFVLFVLNLCWLSIATVWENPVEVWNGILVLSTELII